VRRWAYLESNQIRSAVTQMLFGAARGNLGFLDLSNNFVPAIASRFTPIEPIGFFMESGNVLQCNYFARSVTEGFGTPTNCTCGIGFVFDDWTACSFHRCIRNTLTDGCDNSMVWNSTNCAVAPVSSCVVKANVIRRGRQYYSPATQSFSALTNCSAHFQRKGVLLNAYEFQTATFTSDRLCSICSDCPAGFSAVKCSRTENTRCIKEKELSVVDISVITAVITLLVVVGISAARHFYNAKEKERKRYNQQGEQLELTERLLGDEQENVEQLGRAFEIDIKDLKFGREIGDGAYGTVYAGTWGCVIQ
jgi:hypothetical protein